MRNHSRAPLLTMVAAFLSHSLHFTQLLRLHTSTFINRYAANIAGLPAQMGLYSSWLGIMVYMFLGTSKDVTLGCVAAHVLRQGPTCLLQTTRAHARAQTHTHSITHWPTHPPTHVQTLTHTRTHVHARTRTHTHTCATFP